MHQHVHVSDLLHSILKTVQGEREQQKCLRLIKKILKMSKNTKGCFPVTRSLHGRKRLNPFQYKI